MLIYIYIYLVYLALNSSWWVLSHYFPVSLTHLQAPAASPTNSICSTQLSSAHDAIMIEMIRNFAGSTDNPLANFPVSDNSSFVVHDGSVLTRQTLDVGRRRSAINQSQHFMHAQFLLILHTRFDFIIELISLVCNFIKLSQIRRRVCVCVCVRTICHRYSHTMVCNLARAASSLCGIWWSRFVGVQSTVTMGPGTIAQLARIRPVAMWHVFYNYNARCYDNEFVDGAHNKFQRDSGMFCSSIFQQYHWF